MGDWPDFLEGCIYCGRSRSLVQHRSRGLCRRCVMALEAAGELHKFPPIPDDLSNAKVALARSNPRAFVIDACSLSYAEAFSDHDIKAEALRILDATIRRWRGESVPIFPDPSHGDYAWAEDFTPEYVYETPWWVDIRNKYLPEFRELSRELGVKPPRVFRSEVKLKFLWGRRYNWVAVVFRKKSGPRLYLEHESKGKVAQPMTISSLKEALFTMRSPCPTRGGCP